MHYVAYRRNNDHDYDPNNNNNTPYSSSPHLSPTKVSVVYQDYAPNLRKYISNKLYELKGSDLFIEGFVEIYREGST